jgi:S1-C subfamily serine protease
MEEVLKMDEDKKMAYTSQEKTDEVNQSAEQEPVSDQPSETHWEKEPPAGSEDNEVFNEEKQVEEPDQPESLKAATAKEVSMNQAEGIRPVAGETWPKGHRLLPRRTLFTMMLVSALVGSLLTFTLFYAALPSLMEARGISLSGNGGNGQSVIINPSNDISVYSAVAQKAMPSVVGITTVQTRSGFFSGTQRSEGVGTGVIVDDRGYILTNSHVILDGQADEVMVLLHDGSQHPAAVLWYEQTMDLAVIKIEGAVDLIPAELGDSDALIVGEIVVAIGNPLGLNFERTLTQGVVSGLNRSIPVSQTQMIDNLIQTDASINPGNSGGPLLNAQGQVIGINTAKMQTGEGLGFAIPINTSKPIVDQFIERGEFRRVYLGIRGFNAQNFESATGVVLSVETGVYVVEVVPNSAAEAADLRPGDVITRLGDVQVDTMGNLIRELYKFRPGDETTVTYLRNERENTVNIVLQD